jgi:sugar/nucleoside kinase (ribokinase family)
MSGPGLASSRRVDVACGELAFVDLTFAGLDAIPAPGEERRSQDLLRSPGGGAITAIGVARLGMTSALVSPIGMDPEGDFLRTELAAEGILWAGRTVARTATTAVLPVEGERAMATFDPGEQVTAAELAAVAPAAVVISLPRVALAPAGAAVYATAGDAEARADAKAAVDLSGARALIVNEREARVITGADDAEAAARRLAERTPCAVVTLGPRGAIAAGNGRLEHAPGVAAHAVDTTGAGDLFTAAYVWADRLGAPLDERLRWAVLYAALSVRVPTAHAGAASRATLLEAGADQGLGMPAWQPAVTMKEEAR